MIVAFFESIKYVGHLFPISFFRIYLGYFYLMRALDAYHSGFLEQAYLAEDIRSFIPKSPAPEWYKLFLDVVVIQRWQFFAMFIIGSQLFIAVSYFLGYLVRPAALLGLFLTLNFSLALSSQQTELTGFLLLFHVILGWLGAGRCLGFDYFFYKRRRGLWW